MNWNTIDDFLRPKTWPRKYRRLFVLTFPLSVPLYLVTWSIALLLILLPVCIAAPLAMLAEIWEGDLNRQIEEKEEKSQ